MPVLVVAGATDPRYQVLGKRLAGAVPSGAFCVIPGAGHAVHLEQPELCARVVRSFLDPAGGPGA
jgi:pimeloyl-ACP methyl ester carboxylesterase